METIAVLVMDEHNLIASLDKTGKSLQSELELTLDFSDVMRVDSPGLRAIQDLAHRAEEKKVKVVVRGVNVNVYKTLKLARLTQRFSFAN